MMRGRALGLRLFEHWCLRACIFCEVEGVLVVAFVAFAYIHTFSGFAFLLQVFLCTRFAHHAKNEINGVREHSGYIFLISISIPLVQAGDTAKVIHTTFAICKK